jgi:putative heme-binding domain-containing protein
VITFRTVGLRGTGYFAAIPILFAISLRGQVAGDAARGQTIFEGKGACLACHRVGDKGSYFGPDLSGIARARAFGRGGGRGRGAAVAPAGVTAPDAARAQELQLSIVDPDAEIAPQNRTYRVVTQDGAIVLGRLLNLDTFTVQLMDANSQIQSFDKSSLRSHEFVKKSPMPSYRDKLTAQELADLVAYLMTLKGNVP